MLDFALQQCRHFRSTVYCHTSNNFPIKVNIIPQKNSQRNTNRKPSVISEWEKRLLCCAILRQRPKNYRPGLSKRNQESSKILVDVATYYKMAQPFFAGKSLLFSAFVSLSMRRLLNMADTRGAEQLLPPFFHWRYPIILPLSCSC